MKPYVIGLLILLALQSAAISQISQVTTPPTASIAGQIKLSDKIAKGVAVILTSSNQLAGTDSTKRLSTDDDGRYKFTDLAAGTYNINVLSPGYVVFADSAVMRNGQQVTVKDAEAVERVDFTLTKGGVITGRALSVDNRPVIGEPVSAFTMDAKGKQTPFNPPAGVNYRTDDRGMFRIYGLPPGSYYISVGRGDNRGGGAAFFAATRTYQRTYHPSTSDVQSAEAVAIEAGQELTDVDVRMVSVETFAASGKVVEADTGKPVAGILLAHAVARGGRNGGQGGPGGGGPGGPGGGPGGPAVTDGVSGNDGEFRIEGLVAGKYTAYMTQDGTASKYYSDQAQFEISKSDIDGVEIKLHIASSISGTIVLDGNTDPNLLTNLQVTAMVRGSGASGSNSTSVAPNGNFSISGLSPGRVSLNVMDERNPGPFSGLSITKIDRNGQDVTSGLTLNAGEDATNVRIYITYGTGIIRGTVRVDGGQLTPDMRIMAIARRTDTGNNGGGGGGFGGGFGGGAMPAQVDASGHFQIEQLVGGTYDVTLIVPGVRQGGPGGPGGQGQGQGQGQNVQVANTIPHQTVVLQNGGVQDVILNVSYSSLPAPGTQGNGRGFGQGGNGPGGNGGPGNPPANGVPRRRGGE